MMDAKNLVSDEITARPFHSVEGLSEILGLHTSTIRRAIMSGRLHAVRMNIDSRKPIIRIPREAILCWMQNSEARTA